MAPAIEVSRAVGKAIMIWDFDRTIMDDDSDRWVVTEMGLTHLFNHLRQTLPWNTLMVSNFIFSLLIPFNLIS